MFIKAEEIKEFSSVVINDQIRALVLMVQRSDGTVKVKYIDAATRTEEEIVLLSDDYVELIGNARSVPISPAMRKQLMAEMDAKLKDAMKDGPIKVGDIHIVGCDNDPDTPDFIKKMLAEGHTFGGLVAVEELDLDEEDEFGDEDDFEDDDEDE